MAENSEKANGILSSGPSLAPAPEDSSRVLSPDPISFAPPETLLDQSQMNTSRVDVEEFDEELQADSEMVLSPDPISYALPVAVNMENSEDQPESNGRRKRQKCETEATWEVSFGLFQHHEGGRNYILQMHKIGTGEKNMYHTSVVNTQGNWIVKVKKTTIQQVDLLVPHDEITDAPVRPRNNLSLPERLVGWTIVKKKRTTSGARDKYYTHESSPHRKFRSLIEVSAFILYRCWREDLAAKDMTENEETVRSFLHEAYLNVHNDFGTEHDSKNAEKPHLSGKMEGQKEGTRSGNIGERNQIDNEEHEIFSCALENPIMELEPLES